jgi:hypothetical protein
VEKDNGCEEFWWYEGIAEIIGKMADEGLTPAAQKELSEIFKLAVEGRGRAGAATESLIDIGKRTSSLKLSIKSGMKQLQTMVTTGSVAGVGVTLTSMVNTVLGNVNWTDEALANAKVLLGSGYKRSAIQTSTDIPLDTVNRVLDVASNIKVKLTGVPALDAAARRFSAVAAMEWITKSIDDLSSGRVVGKRAEQLMDRLNKFAFPNEAELKRIIQAGNISDHQLSKAVTQFVSDTQGGVSKANLPKWAVSSPYGELAASLRTFSLEQQRVVGKLIDMAKNGDAKPLTTYLLGHAIVGGVVAWTADTVKDIVSGVVKDDKSALAYMWEGVGQGALGIYYDAVQVGSWDAYTPSGKASYIGLLGGPAASDVAEGIFTGVETANRLAGQEARPFEPAARLIAKWLIKQPVPVVGDRIYNAMFPKGASSGGTGKYLPK